MRFSYGYIIYVCHINPHTHFFHLPFPPPNIFPISFSNKCILKNPLSTTSATYILHICMCCQPLRHGQHRNTPPKRKGTSSESSTVTVFSVRCRAPLVILNHTRTFNWLDLYEYCVNRCRSCGFMCLTVMLSSEASSINRYPILRLVIVLSSLSHCFLSLESFVVNINVPSIAKNSLLLIFSNFE